MHVYLDANIFHGHWRLDATNFRVLARYLNNEGHTLFLSRLVIAEVENLHRRGLDAAYQQMQKGAKEFARLTGSDPALPDRASLSHYDLLALAKAEFDQLEVVDYDKVPQSVVTSRALAPRRPFRENDKGYRDTLIWLSLLDHLRARDPGSDVALITHNTADFLAASGQLHEELLEDLKAYALPCAIVPYASLAAFIDAKVHKDDDALDRSRSVEEFTQFLEGQAEAFFGAGDDAFRRELGRMIVPGGDALARASPIGTKVLDGLEDFDYEATRLMGGDEVAISCLFDLRMVELVMDIPVQDFHAHRDDIRSSHLVVEADPGDAVATVTAIVRPAFRASFTFDRLSRTCRGFAVESWALVGRGETARSALRHAWPQADGSPQGTPLPARESAP